MTAEMKNSAKSLRGEVGETCYKMEQKDRVKQQKRERVINKRTSLGDPVCV